jgi:hypothetical protein
MPNWYYTQNGQTIGPFSQESFLKMFEEGLIKRATKVWKEGTPEWTTLGASDLLPRTSSFMPAPASANDPQPDLLAAIHGLPQVAVAAPGAAVANFGPATDERSFVTRLPFKDLSGVSSALVTLFYVMAGISLLAAVSDALQYRLFADFADGTITGSAIAGAAQSNDRRQMLINIPHLALLIIIGITFLYWLSESNKNIRCLGAERLRFSPGWTMGWWFIPIANLVRPYQILSEIWQGSRNPQTWSMQDKDPRLAWWWTMYIAMNVLSYLSIRWVTKGDPIPVFKTATAFSLFGNLAGVVGALLAAGLVKEIWSHQRAHRYGRAAGDNASVSA